MSCSMGKREARRKGYRGSSRRVIKFGIPKTSMQKCGRNHIVSGDSILSDSQSTKDGVLRERGDKSVQKK